MNLYRKNEESGNLDFEESAMKSFLLHTFEEYNELM